MRSRRVHTTTGLNLYTGVKTPGACNNKVLFSVSTNGGARFTGTTTDPRKHPVVTSVLGAGHYRPCFQWEAFTPGIAAGLLLRPPVRRRRDEREHGRERLDVPRDLVGFRVMRATSTSMPLPTHSPTRRATALLRRLLRGLGAHSGAHPLWMDTRTPDAFLCPGTGVPGVPPALCTATEPNGLQANDQSIYTDGLPA